MALATKAPFMFVLFLVFILAVAPVRVVRIIKSNGSRAFLVGVVLVTAIFAI